MVRRTFLAMASALAAVGSRLRGQNRGELERMAQEQLATTPHKSAEIMRMGSAELQRILKDPGSSEFAKAKACQRLAVVGDEASVPAIAALLGDPRLSHYARTALEPMPGPAASKALREALGRLEGILRVGVINSIAVRRDGEALPLLAELRRSEDADAAAAATSAIHRILRP